MIVELKGTDFVNDSYRLDYDDNISVEFLIIDENFHGSAELGVVNKLIIILRNSLTGEVTREPAVIGFGNTRIGVQSDNPELRGKVLDKDNMSECRILIYE